MRKFAIAAVAVLAIAGSTAVYAQHRHWGYGHSRMNRRTGRPMPTRGLQPFMPASN